MTSTYAPDWSEQEREAYRFAWIRSEPVLLAHSEHDPGECDHCDLLAQLQREADELEAAAQAYWEAHPHFDRPWEEVIKRDWVVDEVLRPIHAALEAAREERGE